jgi:hypothetical protein
MLSSISSYIWGGSAANAAGDGDENPATDGAAAVRPPREPSPFEGGEEWVLVGATPAPGNLSGALEPLAAHSSSSLGSSPASSSVSEAGDDDDIEEPHLPLAAAVSTAAAQVPSGPVRGGHHQDLAVLAETRAVRAGQASSQRASGKALSSKALKRSNKAVMMGGHQRKQLVRASSMPLKMAGANKNLKQC